MSDLGLLSTHVSDLALATIKKRSIHETHLTNAHHSGLASDIIALDLKCREYSPHHPPPASNSKPLYTCAIGRISPEWKDIAVQGRSPVGRFGHQAVLIGHNSKQRKGYQVAVFGGYGAGKESEQWRRRVNLQGLRSDVCSAALLVWVVSFSSHIRKCLWSQLRLLLSRTTRCAPNTHGCLLVDSSLCFAFR